MTHDLSFDEIEKLSIRYFVLQCIRHEEKASNSSDKLSCIFSLSGCTKAPNFRPFRRLRVSCLCFLHKDTECKQLRDNIMIGLATHNILAWIDKEDNLCLSWSPKTISKRRQQTTVHLIHPRGKKSMDLWKIVYMDGLYFAFDVDCTLESVEECKQLGLEILDPTSDSLV